MSRKMFAGFRARMPACTALVCMMLVCIVHGRPAQAAEVVIVKNANTAEYSQPAEALTQRLRSKHKATVMDLTGLDEKGAKRLAWRISIRRPAVVMALGDKALYLAGHMLQGVPVVFGMTSNWRALGLERSRATGVENVLAPETMCSQIKMFFPRAKRIGVIYTNVSKHYVESAVKRTTSMGMKLLPIYISSPNDFRESFEYLAKRIDVFWLVRDPNLITAKNLNWLVKTAAAKRIPVISYASDLVRAGLLMSVVSDPEAVADQMAAMAERIIAGTPPAKIAVVPPDKVKVTINKDVLGRLGIRVDPMLLDFVELVESPPSK